MSTSNNTLRERSRPTTIADRAGEPQAATTPSTSRELVHTPRNQQRKNWLRNGGIIASFAAIATSLTAYLGIGSSPIDPLDYAKRADRVLSTTPLIDGHNDLPYLIRVETKNKIYNGELPFDVGLLSHTDLKRMRQGKLGGQFWSVYVECPLDPQTEIDDPTWAVRDTLEQIDVTKRLVDEYHNDMQFCDTAACARAAFKSGKVGSFIGIEGGHQIGNSLAALRQVYDLGARYITVTHNCDNAFATAASTVTAGGQDLGLTTFGREFVQEMNRLGMLIDLSHVSHNTMRDVLAETKSPVIFSHSSSYAISKHLRNVPDDVVRSVAQNGGVIMVTFVPKFLKVDDPSSVTIHDAVDHIFHIAEVAGWDHVGLGSDFDGVMDVPKGLEDVSKYPRLIELLLERGATDEQARKLAGDNLLRVWSEVEGMAARIQGAGEKPNEETWSGRRWVRGDLPLPFMFRNSASSRIPGKSYP